MPTRIELRAMEVIPNPNLGWEDWKKFGMAIWRASGGSAEGFVIFDKWSQKSDKYDVDNTKKAWDQITRSAPSRIGAGTIFYYANIAAPGWDGRQSDENQGIHSWDDPDISLLDNRRGELPEFPLQELPEELQPIIERVAHGAGVSNDHVAVPLISISGSLIGAVRRIRASASWSQPMTPWGAVVGSSGDGKTPGLEAIKKALDQVEEEFKSEIDAQRREHDLRDEQAKAAQKAWKKEVDEAVKNKTTLPQKPAAADDPGKFITPRLYTIDVTIERMAELLAARPRGMLLISDELAGWFTNMSRYSGGEDKQFWLICWDGGAYSVERKSAPIAIKVPNLLVGILGGLQPDKLADCFKGAADGMYARFLFAWPSRAPYRPLVENVQEIDNDIVGMFNRLARLDKRDFPRNRIPLSQQATEIFEELRKLVYEEIDTLDGRARDWWAKVPAHVLRLAGTLAFMRWGVSGDKEPEKISVQDVGAALALVLDYFWPHAQASLRQIGLSQHNTDARRVLQWIKATGQQQVSREEVRRNALSRRRDADGTEITLTQLERAGWVRRRVTQTNGRPANCWEVNPQLFGGGA